jgi:hypothetical protein
LPQIISGSRNVRPLMQKFMGKKSNVHETVLSQSHEHLESEVQSCLFDPGCRPRHNSKVSLDKSLHLNDEPSSIIAESTVRLKCNYRTHDRDKSPELLRGKGVPKAYLTLRDRPALKSQRGPNRKYDSETSEVVHFRAEDIASLTDCEVFRRTASSNSPCKSNHGLIKFPAPKTPSPTIVAMP